MDYKSDLSSLYGSSSKDREEFRKLLKLLPLIEAQIHSRYKFVGKIAKGGAGVVLKVVDTNLNVIRALKCARPVAGTGPILAKVIASEISMLRGTSHQNVVTLFYSDSVKYGRYEWPYYVMEYVEGGTDFYQYLQSNKIPQSVLISMLRQFVEGNAYLHSQGMIHGDIKLENALATPAGRVMISDLGSARYLSGDTGETMLIFSKPWAHPFVLRGAKPSPTDENRARKETRRNELSFWMDLYPLGKNLLRVLELIDPSDSESLSPYTRTYLHLIAARLLDGHNQAEDELPLGISGDAFKELKYTSLSQVVDDLRKLTGEYPLTAEVPELDEHYPHRIQCSFPKACAFTTRVQRILEVSVVRRLGEISQLGMLVYVYPTATHTRLEHSLGAYAVAARFCNALWNDPINPLFRQIMAPKHLRTLLCAALCHDIGQFGLAHDFEEANKSAFDHTALTTKVLKGELGQHIWKPLHDVLENEWGVSPKDVVDVLTADPTDLSQPILNRLLHTMISGPIDADKADYLLRDSRKLGVPYGDGVDLERLIDCLTVTFRVEPKGFYVSMGVHENGKIAAEAMAFARYALFGSAYWHHTSRALKSMLHRAIWDALPAPSNIAQFGEFCARFEEFVFENVFSQQQLEFNIFDPVKLPQSAQLSLGDVRALKWLYQTTTDAGKELVAQILDRKPFKRLLVVSHAKEQVLWDQLHATRLQFSDYKQFSQFQSIFQKLLVHEIASIDLNRLKQQLPIASVLSPEVIKEMRDKHEAGKILIIIDIPGTRPGSVIELEYLSEERIQGRRQIGRATSLEDSIVWNAINTRFVESVGKIRIFVHPAYSSYFEIMITRKALKRQLHVAENELKAELSKSAKRKAPHS